MASKRRLSVSEDAGSSVVDVDGVSHTSMDSNNSQESANLLARIANPLNNGEYPKNVFSSFFVLCRQCLCILLPLYLAK